MRATISFEIDLDQVEGTMGMLISQEAHNLRVAADILEDYKGSGDNLLEEVTNSLRLLRETMGQLEQYQQMMAGFEKAKFETILPTAAPAPIAVQSPPPQQRMSFDSFVDRMAAEEEGDDSATTEG